MKITRIKTFVLEAGIFVKVETDAGIYGLGEAGMKRRGRAIAEVVHSMAPDLVGQDPFRIEHLWQVMFRGGFFPGGGVQTSALSAEDIALWDIKGKALGVPVYELLGGRVRDRVVCYPHNGDPRSIDTLVENCRDKQALGWNFARWGIVDPEGGGPAPPTDTVASQRPTIAAALMPPTPSQSSAGSDQGPCGLPDAERTYMMPVHSMFVGWARCSARRCTRSARPSPRRAWRSC